LHTRLQFQHLAQYQKPRKRALEVVAKGLAPGFNPVRACMSILAMLYLPTKLVKYSVNSKINRDACKLVKYSVNSKINRDACKLTRPPRVIKI